MSETYYALKEDVVPIGDGSFGVRYSARLHRIRALQAENMCWCLLSMRVSVCPGGLLCAGPFLRAYRHDDPQALQGAIVFKLKGLHTIPARGGGVWLVDGVIPHRNIEMEIDP